MRFHVVTLFPEVCKAYTDASILGRAQAGKGQASKKRGKIKKIKISYYNPRDYTKDKHRKVDDRSYGGGPGMVLQAEPVLAAVVKALGKLKGKDGKKKKILITSPRGKLFDQAYAKRLAKSYENIVLIAGHYEGIDARVKKILRAEEVSVGPYVLTGGELPALTVIDAVARNIKGVLGTGESLEDTRVASGEMYTRPEVFTYKGKKYRTPQILLGGNHKEIKEWRRKHSSP